MAHWARRALCSQVDPCGWPSIAQSREICLHEQVIRKLAAIVGSALFLVIAPGFRCRLGALVDLPLAIPICLLGIAAPPLGRRNSHHSRHSWPPRFVPTIRGPGARHAGAGLSDPPFGDDWALSLCAESDVRGGGERHHWPGFDLWEYEAGGVRWACLAPVSPFCVGLSRTDAKSELWR